MPRTLEGLPQPAQLHGKATPQINNRVSSCKPRVSVSEVVILKRQGLQPMADPVSPMTRRFSSRHLSRRQHSCRQQRELYHICGEKWAVQCRRGLEQLFGRVERVKRVSEEPYPRKSMRA